MQVYRPLRLRAPALATLSAVLILNSGAVRADKGTVSPSLDRMMTLLSSVRTIGDVAISPDGKRVAWTTSPAPTKSHSTIYVADLNATRQADTPSVGSGRKLTPGAASYDEQSIAWASDSSSIAFLSDKGNPGQLQLYVAPAAGGVPRRLTNLKGFLADPHWSPDGKTIAILFTENAPRAAGPLQPATIQTGVIESHIYEQRLTTVDVLTGRVRQISPADLYIYEYDWSPDSKTFAGIAAHGDGDNNWFIAELWTIAAESAEAKSISKPQMQIAVP
ncbi:MAG TPA: hypothetical protein VFV34_13500, partial [Blastocatellia bacterium]|nr:hypothetical protein [Blastocatellia bacterium]